MLGKIPTFPSTVFFHLPYMSINSCNDSPHKIRLSAYNNYKNNNNYKYKKKTINNYIKKKLMLMLARKFTDCIQDNTKQAEMPYFHCGPSKQEFLIKLDQSKSMQHQDWFQFMGHLILFSEKGNYFAVIIPRCWKDYCSCIFYRLQCLVIVIHRIW